MSAGYSDKQIKFIQELKEKGFEWEDIAAEFLTEFGEKKTANAMRKTFNRYKLDTMDISDDTLFTTIKGKRRTDVANQRLRKERKTLIDYSITIDDLLEEFENSIKKINKSSFGKKLATPKKTGKTRLIPEAIISDIHFGLKTETYDADIARKRIKYYCESFIKEVKRKEKVYDIDEIHILMLGDLMQGNELHKDSQSSCHLTDAQQIAIAIEVLYFDFVLPISKLGYKVNISCLSGNHDRGISNRYTVNPGIHYLSYTIYKGIEMLSTQSGFDNVKVTIPVGCFYIYKMFNSYFLAEHGDNVKGCTTAALEAQIAKRQNQFGEILSGIRIGHYHNFISGSLGRFIVSGSSVSSDHYGNMLGYVSRPTQVMNFYVDTDRDSSYYHSFEVDLSRIK